MPTLLTSDIIDFMESGEVSLYVAGCSAQLRPCATRAFGCRIARRSGVVTTWVSAAATSALLANISGNGRLALVVSHIETCRTFQLKAMDAAIAALKADDHEHIATYHDAFIAKAIGMGYPEPMMRSMMQYRLDQITPIDFTPAAVFAQTPGPGAGATVASESAR